MDQLEFKTTEKPALAALKADAETWGELKNLAERVLPKDAKKDLERARDKLSDCLREKHAQKLEIDQAVEIIVEAVVKNGRSGFIEYVISRFPKDSCDFKWNSREERVQRAIQRAADLLPQAEGVAAALLEACRVIKEQK